MGDNGLNAAIKRKLNSFRLYTVSHPLLVSAYAKLRKALKEPAGKSLIFIYGPSGVGKTTLRIYTENKIIEELSVTLEENRGQIPVVSLELVAPSNGDFSWKDYYKRALYALEEPLVDYKYNHSENSKYFNKSDYSIIGSKPTANDFRLALEKALYYRCPIAVFLDEAQHLSKMSSGRRMQDQLDSIKSLANMSNTMHVLIGTYELLPLCNLSAQLSRRSYNIHFSRYTLNKEDITSFKSVIYSFQKNLPLLEEPNLVQHWDFIYERTLGCVGILKDWLTQALNDTLNEGEETIDISCLERNALSVKQCEKLLNEIVEGESEIREHEDAVKKLRYALGIEFDDNNNSKTSKKRNNKRVGQRRPTRDSINMDNQIETS